MNLSSRNTARGLATGLMLFALSWLSISLPIINAALQQQEAHEKATGNNEHDHHSDTTADTTEENTESKANFPAEEFLQEFIDHNFGTDITLSPVHARHQDNYSSFFADTDIQPPRA